MNGHNKIAAFYDVLGFVVFGNKLEIASKTLTQWLYTEKTILVLGGGTGKILEFFNADHQVHYIDISEKMIERARKRSYKCSVLFECEDFRFIKANKTYDAIICPFFLDVFEDYELPEILNSLKKYCNSNTSILVSDFDTRSTLWTNHFLMKLMLWFFHTIKAIPSKQFNGVFKFLDARQDLQQLEIKKQQQGFIVSAWYKFI